MKSPAIFTQIKKQYQSHAIARREVMTRSNDALSKSKRAIFSLHRGDTPAAISLLSEADILFVICEKHFRVFADLKDEGSFRAALEENAEAQLFLQYVKSEPTGKISARLMDPLIYLGGLADCTGEIVRYAMKQVTAGNTIEVKHAHATVEIMIAFLLDLDLTGYLRTKFDQAKTNLRSLEEMMYELALRKRE